jgi:uncharacterized membrane protein
MENTTPTGHTDQRRRRRVSFWEDLRRFFLRGLAAVTPTLITLWLVLWVWNFLWSSLGQHLIWVIQRIWLEGVYRGIFSEQSVGYIKWYWRADLMRTRVVGVLLAVLMVYVVGVFVGNFIGQTAWRLVEVGVMRIPLIRTIYPAVKQVTDFLLAERQGQFEASRVVAVEPHAKGIWSIGLVTGAGLSQLSAATAKEMVTVFVPSSPTAFSGYVLMVPRDSVVELPLTVEEAMRLLVSGGVIAPLSHLAGDNREITKQEAKAHGSHRAPPADSPSPHDAGLA